jgi:hypothetical protein
MLARHAKDLIHYSKHVIRSRFSLCSGGTVLRKLKRWRLDVCDWSASRFWPLYPSLGSPVPNQYDDDFMRPFGMMQSEHMCACAVQNLAGDNFCQHKMP